MNSPTTCQSCGARLTSGLEFSFCPQCLVREAANPAADDSDLPPTSDQCGSPGSRFQPPSAKELESLLTGFKVSKLVGHGGMGAVYRGQQVSLDRDVAIKILPREFQASGQSSERFQREAKTLAKLHHPNIVAIFDFGQVDGLYYFVMEYVDGVTLRETIQSKTITPDAALKMIPVICDALQFAHSRGVIHRDIKPENILIDREGTLKIADFGLAKMLNRDGEVANDLNLTGTQQVMGTAAYMAPEQMTTSKTVDHRADIYSLGVVFYELLTGERPVGWFPPPSKKVAVDVRVDEVVLRTLESEPERRYQQISEFKTAIENLSNDSLSQVNGGNRRPASSPTASSLSSVRLHKLLDETETYYRTLHSVSTALGLSVFPLLGVIVAAAVSPLVGVVMFVVAVATVIYSVRIKRHQVFKANYKGHTIVVDNSGTFAEKLYLDDGLVRTGGFGTKMEFRFSIKAGEGIGDEIIVWFDAGVRTLRCRIEAESKSD